MIKYLRSLNNFDQRGACELTVIHKIDQSVRILKKDVKSDHVVGKVE